MQIVTKYDSQRLYKELQDYIKLNDNKDLLLFIISKYGTTSFTVESLLDVLIKEKFTCTIKEISNSAQIPNDFEAFTSKGGFKKKMASFLQSACNRHLTTGILKKSIYDRSPFNVSANAQNLDAINLLLQDQTEKKKGIEEYNFIAKSDCDYLCALINNTDFFVKIAPSLYNLLAATYQSMPIKSASLFLQLGKALCGAGFNENNKIIQLLSQPNKSKPEGYENFSVITKKISGKLDKIITKLLGADILTKKHNEYQLVITPEEFKHDLDYVMENKKTQTQKQGKKANKTITSKKRKAHVMPDENLNNNNNNQASSFDSSDLEIEVSKTAKKPSTKTSSPFNSEAESIQQLFESESMGNRKESLTKQKVDLHEDAINDAEFENYFTAAETLSNFIALHQQGRTMFQPQTTLLLSTPSIAFQWKKLK